MSTATTLKPLTLEAYQALQADREARGESDEAKGEWVLDHYRKRVEPLIGEEAFAKILLTLDRLTLFNLDNYRDPYLMRESKILRESLTPVVLKLAERVREYNERGEIVPKGTGEARLLEKEREKGKKEKEAKLVGGKEDGKDKVAKDEAALAGTHEADKALDPAQASLEQPALTLPASEALSPEEITSLVASYEDLSARLEALLEEDEEEDEDMEGDEEYRKVREKVMEEMKKEEKGGKVEEGKKEEVAGAGV